MKNQKSIKKILMGIILLTGILFSTVAFAAPSQIILFCSSWNMKCRNARTTYATLAKELTVKYIELDIDNAYSQQQANELGLNFPTSIPYVYILDYRGKVVKQGLYRGESSQELMPEIMSKLNIVF